MKFNEQATVENYIIQFLEKNLGYQYIKPEDFSKFRELESEYIITDHLFEAVKKINDCSSDIAKQIVIEVKKLDTNEAFLQAMRNGIDLKDSETQKTKNYQIVDYKNSDNNLFIVTNQFYFEGNAENIRPDILVFLNGLPVTDIEAKSPTASSSINYENGIDQLKRYEKNARKLFLSNCFNISSDGLKTVYGATYCSKQYFFSWRDDDKENDIEDELESTLTALLKKENFLDIIQNFIVFEREQEQKVKKIARYQQIRATNRIIDRIKKGDKKRGLIWHTQGSGKSLTMFFTAWKLRFADELKNPKVFVLMDRIDLDDQIFKTFKNCGGQNIIRVTSKKELAEKIINDERGIFISTMQKFNDLPDGIQNDKENIIVLSDEGHRTNEGFASINMRASMQNAFFFGFTGTPIDKKFLNTHRNYGQDGERYLDYYSIQQAIEDGATLPVTYEARLSKFYIDDSKLDEQFEELTTDLSQKEKQEISKKYGKKQALVKLDKRMEAIAQDIIEHYKLYIQPNGFKAQVVCYDREATAKYKKLFDHLVPKDWSAVVYSLGDPNSDDEELKKYNTSKNERDSMINDFKDPNNPLRFLLVCDMLLTGFDEPVEQVMYLDKPLWDHNLLQAIARTNRVYKHKGAGMVIDYYGITKSLHKALDFDESEISSAMINIDKLKEEFVDIIEELADLFVGINIEDPSIDNLRRCLKIFRENDNKRQFFVNKYSRLKILFEILSPDPFLKKYMRVFEWYTSFNIAFAKEFNEEKSDSHILSQYGEKIKSIIQNEVNFEGITKNFRVLKIDELAKLEKLNKIDDEDKAINLEKMLKQEISIHVDSDPVYKKFSQRLNDIKKEFEKNQIDLAERIKRYVQLLDDIKHKDEEAKELGLNLREYGLYIISQEFIDTNDLSVIKDFVEEMAGRLEEILDEGWQESSKREEFIKDIKKIIQQMVLRDYVDKIEVKDFHKFLNRLVDIIFKKF